MSKYQIGAKQIEDKVMAFLKTLEGKVVEY